jgi:hypothetical protein
MNHKVLSIPNKLTATHSETDYDRIPANRKKLAAPFKRTLTSIWDLLNNKNIYKPKSPIILSIGCGRSLETTELFEFYGDNLTLIGVDIDRNELDHATKKLTPHQKQKTQFKLGLGQEKEIFDDILSFNLLWVRHPNTHMDPEQWSSIIQNTFEELEVGGTFITTLYFEKDYLAAKIIFKNLNYSLDIDIQKNSFSSPIPEAPGFAHDHYILGAHKRPGALSV